MPADKPWEDSTGTCVPMFMVAGMLSVAMMLGAEITLDLPFDSCMLSSPNNCVFLRMSAPAVSANPPGPAAAVKTVLGLRPLIVLAALPFEVVVLLLFPDTPVAALLPFFCTYDS